MYNFEEGIDRRLNVAVVTRRCSVFSYRDKFARVRLAVMMAISSARATLSRCEKVCKAQE